jgi:predicted nucleic acid-binding protein
VIDFFDASALVKRYVAEAGSAAVQRATRRETVAVARIAHAEVAASLARAARAQIIAVTRRDEALDRLDEDMARWRVVELRPRVAARARALVCAHPLRGYDAVQLASILDLRDHGAAVRAWCTDTTLCAAIEAEGISLVRPG